MYEPHNCKHLKGVNESCKLNNNCKFPNCSESQQQILKQLQDIVNGKE